MIRLLIPCLALAACSTTSIADLQQRAPAAHWSTSRAPADVANCLVEQLGHLGAPLVREDGTARIVSFTIENDTTAIFRAEPGQLDARILSGIIPFRRKAAACAGAAL